MGDQLHRASSDAELLHNSLIEIGFDVHVEEEIQALTASAQGDAAFFALVVMLLGIGSGWKSFCTELGKELAHDAHLVLKSIFSRRRVVIQDDRLRAVIDTDTPAEAIEQLADPPDAPSGELVWDPVNRRWKDSRQ